MVITIGRLFEAVIPWSFLLEGDSCCKLTNHAGELADKSFDYNILSEPSGIG